MMKSDKRLITSEERFAKVTLTETISPTRFQLVTRVDWCPRPLTACAGRELSLTCYLGPFFSLSLLPPQSDDRRVVRVCDVAIV
jgi:hypothetical protein